MYQATLPVVPFMVGAFGKFPEKLLLCQTTGCIREILASPLVVNFGL